MRRLAVRFGMLLVMLGLATARVSADDEGVAGRWEGTVALADREVPIAVDLAPAGAGGAWMGSVVLSGLGVKGAPLSEIAVSPRGVTFALAQGDRGVSLKVEARLEGTGRLSGTLSRAGRSTPLALRRTGDAQPDRPLASTSVASGALGEWHGGYELFGYPRKVTLRLSNEGAVAHASFVIEGKRHNDLPVDLVRQEGDTLFVTSSGTGIRFEGRLAAGAGEIVGAVLQGPLEIPVTLRRGAGGGQ